MVVCKFFLEGRCRFGDRCYNEHVAAADRYQQQPDQQQYHWYRQEQQQQQQQDQRQRYASPPRYSDNHHRYESSPPRYPDNQRHQSPFKAQEDRYHQHYAGHSSNNNRQGRYGGGGGDENFDYASDRYDNAPNPYSWKSTDYGSQRGGSNYNRYDGYQADFENDRHKSYGQSKNQSSGHQSRNRFDVLRSSENKMEPALDSSSIEILKEDMVACDEGKQWPFSCYFPFRGHPGFPEFNDVSFEELRNEAYEAEKNSNFPEYVRSYVEALVEVQHKRDMLKKPNRDVINAVNEIQSKQLDLEVDPVKKQLFFSSLNDSDLLKNDGTPSFFNSPQQTSQSSFSLSHLTSGNPSITHSVFNLSKPNSVEMNSCATGSVFQPSAGKFFNNDVPSRFGTSSDFVQKLSAADNLESDFYTALEDLTKEELEAFSASTFTAGKIPIRPPPKSLCFE